MGTDLRQPPGTGTGDPPPGAGTAPRSRPGLLGVLGAAVALVLVFAAVRLTASPAPPAPPAGPELTDPTLFDLPTRGSLAGDAGWVDGVRRAVPPTDLPGERRVAFAGDAAGQRVALVLGRSGRRIEAAWLVGPRAAAPEQMRPATAPLVVAPYGPVSLWDVPEAGAGGRLVVVTMPDDAVDVLSRRSVTADGVERQVRARLTTDGGVAAVPVAAPVAESGRSWGARVVVNRNGIERTGTDVLSDRARASAVAPVDPADPRGLRGQADEPLLQLLLHQLMGTYGLPAGQVSPVLLATGAVGPAGDRAVLVGITLPSGATAAALGVVGSGDGDPVPRTVRTAPAPAGTAIGERILAVPAGWAVSRLPLPLASGPPPGWLVVSGPAAGARADVLDASGAVVAALPLTGGAGAGPVAGQAATVRVLDAAGRVLGEAPVSVLTR
jgi:hypothetical protein